MEATPMFAKSAAVLFLLAALLSRPSYASEMITSFSFGAGGMSKYECWSMTVESKDGKTLLEMDMTDEDGPFSFKCRADASLLSDIERLAEKYSIAKWDGFNKTSKMALDGDSFGLSVKYASGKTVKARGYVLFPKGLIQFKSELIDIRDKAVEKYRPHGNGCKSDNQSGQ